LLCPMKVIGSLPDSGNPKDTILMISDIREVALDACIENSLAGAVQQFEDFEEGVLKE